MKVIDRLLFPLLAILSPERSRRLGLTPIDDERLMICLRHCRGRVLDVGCGFNRLVPQHPAGGVGVDVFPWPGIDLQCRSDQLPFKSGSFDTVTMTAVLNHIPSCDRERALLEIRRVLRCDGQLLITMIAPLVGRLTHRIRRAYDSDQRQRGIGSGEDLGLSDTAVRTLVVRTGFTVERRIRFVWWLNNLYICRKSDGVPAGPLAKP